MPELTSVSIIIATRDRAEHLRGTLCSFNHVTVPDRYVVELIVVDNGSTDDTKEVVNQCVLDGYSIRYLFEPVKVKSRAINRAHEMAAGDILLFTDDDVRPAPNWISAMCQPIVSGRADAVVGSVTLAPHLVKPWMRLRHRKWLAELTFSDREIALTDEIMLVGANMGYARKVLERVKDFDPELGAGALGFYEETLFGLQVAHAGFRIVPVPESEVEHHFDANRATSKVLRTASAKIGQSKAYVDYHWRHMRGRTFPLLLALTSIDLAVAGIGCVFNGGEVTERELQLTMWAGYYRQFMSYKQQPRHYERHGLVKIAANTSP